MKDNYSLQHKTALLNPYGSIVKVLDGDPEKLLVGIKNVRSIPKTLMHRLEPVSYTHLDVYKRQGAVRAGTGGEFGRGHYCAGENRLSIHSESDPRSG